MTGEVCALALDLALDLALISPSTPTQPHRRYQNQRPHRAGVTDVRASEDLFCLAFAGALSIMGIH